MANKMTIALTKEQYEEIIKTMLQGGAGFKKNPRIATALVLEANLGLRIEDILNLHLKDIVKDGSRYRLDIYEKKTNKKRTFTVPLEIFLYIENYCIKNNIGPAENIFPIKERGIQSYLRKVSDYLGYENIGTHSFRKYYATDIYYNNEHDIMLIQKLLQHSSTAVTQRYINISEKKVEDAINGHINLI